MKKILSLVLVLVLVLTMVACNQNPEKDTETESTTETEGNTTEKTYSLALAVDTAFGRGNKVVNFALALVIDADGKIVAARMDTVEVTPELDAEGNLVAKDAVATKAELGDSYTGMNAGSWAAQATVLENWLVGKTAAEIAATEFTGELIAGCTMTSSMATVKALVAEAFASELKVSFTTADAFTTGLALSTVVKSGRGGSVTVSTEIGALVVAGDKIAAAAIDTIEQSYTVAEGALTPADLAASKAEQGDAYTMAAGAWYKQAAVFCNALVGKTAAELEAFEPVSDALAEAGCTMQSTPAGYKTNLIKAIGNVK